MPAARRSLTLEEVADGLHAEMRRLAAQLEEVSRRLPPTLGSLRDAAKVLQCDPSTVYRAYKRGEIAGRQIGGRIFIDLAALRPATDAEVADAAWTGRRP
jgi:transcriptional regulator with XRE-family HTH domain